MINNDQKKNGVNAAAAPSSNVLDDMKEFLTDGYWSGNGTAFASGTITVNLNGLTSEGKKLARWALEAWESVANLNFIETGSSNAGITFIDDNLGAYAQSFSLGGVTTSATVNIGLDWLNAYYTEMDTYSLQTYIHEIGHALGLGHQGNYNGSATFGIDNIFADDSWQLSVMSYFSQTDNTNTNGSYAFTMTPMLVDILAIQDLYGAPTGSGGHGGNTVYGKDTNVGGYLGDLFDAIIAGTSTSDYFGDAVAITIYDQGGRDLIDLTFSNIDTVLNLKAGAFSDVLGQTGNLIIALDTVIEDAKVGNGDDRVTGNSASNTIYGNGGNDVLSGEGGNDRLYGGDGNDHVSGGAGNDRVYAGKGTDKVELGDGNDYVKVGGGLNEEFHGGAGKDYISYYDSTNGVNVNLETNVISGSWAGNDIISGFESVSGSKTGDDKIYGTSGSNTIRTFGGDDRVYAGSGADKVELGDGNDYVKVGGGKNSFDGGAGKDYISYYAAANGITIDLDADTVSGSLGADDTIKNFESASGSKTGSDKMYGTSGSNTLKAFGGDDKLYGRSGDDKLYGGDGEDRLDGGAGTDLLYGGADADVFHFNLGEDHDIIKDFENNVDTIQLDNFTFSTGQDAFDFAVQIGSDVIFDFGGGDMLTVENTTLGQLYNDLEVV